MLDLAAAGAGQVAGEQRLDLHDQRVLLAAQQLLAQQVGADAQVLAKGDGHQRTSAGSRNWMVSSTTRRSSTVDGTEGVEGGDDALDQRLGGRRAGGDADRAGAGQPRRGRARWRRRPARPAQPARRATSASRLVLDELAEPTTTTRSHSGAMARTASWRFCVA